MQYLLNVKSRKFFCYNFLILKIGICISFLLKSNDRAFFVWMVQSCLFDSPVMSIKNINS